MKKFLYKFLLIFFVLSIFSCSSTKFETIECVANTHADDVEFASSIDTLQVKFIQSDLPFYKKSIYLQKEKSLIHIIKFDLNNKNLVINSYPDKKNRRPIKIKKFAYQNDLNIAINTNPYTNLIFNKKIVGINYNDKILFSTPVNKYAAFAFTKIDEIYKFKIYESQEQVDINSLQQTIIHGGFWQIIKNKQIINFKDIKNSRTCLASDKNNNLYILIVEGEKKRESIGLSYNECAQILLKLNCDNAIQLDGGSSTSLFINKKNALSYYKNPRLPSFIGFKFID